MPPPSRRRGSTDPAAARSASGKTATPKGGKARAPSRAQGPRKQAREAPERKRRQEAARKAPQRPHKPQKSKAGAGAGGAAGGAAAGAAGIRLTGRGGVLVIMAASLSAALTAEATGWGFLNGAAFVVACVLAALLVRPSDLLGLTVSPPLAYFTAAVAAECVLTLGSTGFVRALALGMGTRLADIAPWLFLGTALVLIISVFRGLPSNVRDFSDELNGRRPRG
ncbi:hypothetical protein O4J56_22435 [Nocardiopsis sp. RSe5-2]|uniref:DUF6542 domain-containing protein n=1 Tax=Nocardiopsis endophytica TaxID=3018445 RepID=A0ABT4U8Z6_9ACTN|nr:DUF6542 domain-containing protein [Nocardiopsis endophytica]MDA2813421.1 hypothetical protein [Nocardiopsis endophytica]